VLKTVGDVSQRELCFVFLFLFYLMHLLFRILTTQFPLPGVILNKVRSFQGKDIFAAGTFWEIKRLKLAAVYGLCERIYRSHLQGLAVCLHQMRRLTLHRQAGQRHNAGGKVK
jgi:hypothetical protein